MRSLYGTPNLINKIMISLPSKPNTNSCLPSKKIEIVLKSITIIKTLLRTMATRLAVSQSPQSLQIPGMDVMVGRETSCGLEEKRLNVSDDQGFLLPPNMREAFPNEDFEWADYQVKYHHLLNFSFFPSFLHPVLSVCFPFFFYFFLLFIYFADDSHEV